MYFSRSKREKREHEMKRFAYGIEGDYYSRDAYHQVRLLKDFALFRQGHSRRIYNLVVKDGIQKEINVFDYKYIIQAGNTPVPVMQTVFFINSKRLALPKFLMQPEHFFHKIGQFLGMQDIDFIEYPKFSNQYLLQGEYEGLIRSTFKDSLLHFFSLERGWYLEGINYYLIFYKKKKILPPKEIEQVYNQGMYLYEQFAREEGLG